MIFFNRQKESTIEVTVSNRTIVRVILFGIASFVAITAVEQAAHALTLLFTALFLALALNAPVHWIAQHMPGKKRGNRSLATAVSFILVIAMLGAFLASIIPPLVKQTNSFIDSVPDLVRDVRNPDTSSGKFVEKYKLQDEIDKMADQASTKISSFSGSLVDTVGKLTSSIVSILTVLVLTYMMLLEGPRWIAFARRLIPDDKEDHAAKLTMKMYRVIKGYVNGQVLLAAIASAFILPALLILGVSYPFALMVIVFICGLIPLVGHTIGAIIVSLVALFTSPVTALIVLVYYITYQQIENYAIQPKIQANSTDMSPLLVFASVIVGVSFNGLLGGLVAIPIAGCLRILVLDYLHRKKIIEPAKL